ncbi:amino acid oxidase [Podospora didyma]|uniref:Amino acid oxidase n=1 Tax=Podospora didyma TaxID=330526 RepID=A0AAE0P6Q7_9PEZI|nr:amino acid oxidase [Podospora didyma]
MAEHIVVIGAGVIGLSAALSLQDAGHSVTIIARDFPGPAETMDAVQHINYTSPWGGAHNRWVPPHPTTGENAREHAMALTTFARMRTLSDTPSTAGATGISFMKGIEYLEGPVLPAEYVALDADKLSLPAFRVLDWTEFPDKRVQWGCEYDTWCVNPMVYCCFLLRRFVFRGGKIVRRELRSPLEVFALSPEKDLGISAPPPKVVVNASGNGFGGSSGDDGLFITRGQTVLVANTSVATVTRQNADGGWTFCVPRNYEGGTIIGGTKEPDNWDPNPSPEVRETLLKTFAATYPQILDEKGGFTVIRDIVGRRPTRKGGLRLEGEAVQGGGFVMHAYGLGGRGYELSWGVAEGVVEGVQEYLKGRTVET